MKTLKLLLLIPFFICHNYANGQGFITQTGSDTAYQQYTGGNILEIDNNIKSATANSVFLKWNLLSYHFDPGWDSTGTIFCDNIACFSHSSIFSGQTFKSQEYTQTYGIFHALFGAYNPLVGSCAYMRMNVTDTVSNMTKIMTFTTCMSPTGIHHVNADASIMVFPNPAVNTINLLFDTKIGINKAVILNLIGKTILSTNAIQNGSVQINISNITAGIYFIQLKDKTGAIVATRKFSKE